MPMPTKEEGWIYIDRLAHIRAIYIPITYSASDQYSDLCAFLHVNFTRSKTIGTKHYEYGVTPNWRTDTPEGTFGLMVNRNWALGINIHALTTLLSLPRQLRAQDSYSSECIIQVKSNLIPTVSNVTYYSDDADFNWTKVVEANHGLQVQWKPAPPPDFATDFFQNPLTEAVGFIPIIGPIAAIALPLTWTAIFDPDAFVNELISLVPGMALSEMVIDETKKSGSSIKGNLPGNWRGPRGFLQSSTQALATAADSSEKTREPRLLTEEEGVVDVSFQLTDIILRQSKGPNSEEEEDESFGLEEVIARIPATEGQSVSSSDLVNDFDWAKEYLKRFKAIQSLPEAYIENIQPETDASSQ